MTLLPFLEVLAVLAWVSVIVAAGWLVFGAARGGRQVARPAAWLAAGALGAALLSTLTAGLVFIEPTERGVLITALRANAVGAQPLAPGLHWIVPVAERVEVYSIATTNYTLHFDPVGDQPGPIRARTNDGQEVFMAVAVLYAPEPSEVVRLHVDWQDRYPDVVVVPLVSSLLRDTASQYGIEEIVSTQRAEVERLIAAALAEKLAEHHLRLDEFVLHDIRFSPEYAAAVEQKQIAEQQALQAAITVQQRRQEAEGVRLTAQGAADAAVIAAEGRAQATLLQGQAEAESLRLVQAALEENPDMLSFRYIDQLSSDVSVIYLPGAPATVTPTAP
jgi:regulator of protease activity HflC (stomatin/prohibitin superfamily)